MERKKMMRLFVAGHIVVFVASVMVLGFTCGIVDAFVSPIPPRASIATDASLMTLYAEGGPPPYSKQLGVLRDVQVVGNGSVLLHIQRSAPPNKDKAGGDDMEEGLPPPPLEYGPGHVLALEIQGDPKAPDVDEKTRRDMEQNDGWMRGPYTVTRCNPNDSSLDILIKVVGAKSKVLATSPPGTPVRFGGKFHIPIIQGIAPRTERIVMISTGVGVGPCVGAIEKLLSDKTFDGTIDLFACYREEEDELFADYLNVWATAYKHFRYHPIITSRIGRLSSSEVNVGLVVNDNNVCSLTETHYHLIGNGQMVSEWKAGLSKAGVPSERITVESYFNHQQAPSEEAIQTIATVIREAARRTVNPISK
jgi:ferredoxin-NADP reductase